MSTFTSEPGAKLAGRYRLEDRVNAASGWAAWKAIDETLARPVTVLTFVPGFPRIAEVVTAARAASRLTDSRLSQVFDVEDGEDERAYIVMEWVAGDSLDDLLAGGPLDPGYATALITEASRALAGAHAAGLAHLCLTPDSLRYTQGGGVKITGLGIDAALAGITADDAELADTQGLGRLLYATLTGHWAGLENTSLPPAPVAEGQPRSPRQVRAGVPAAIDAVTCEALMQRPRRGKPPLTTPALLAQALAEVAPPTMPPPPAAPDGFAANRTMASPEPPPGHWPPPGPVTVPRGRHGQQPAAPGKRAVTTSAVIAIVVVVLLAAIGVGGWLLSTRHNSPPAPQPSSSTPAPPPTASVLRPASATAADNPQGAAAAIDGSKTTYWHTEFYIGNPVFGGLYKGTGLVLDMGKQITLRRVQILLGPSSGADVQIKLSDSPVSPRAAESVPTVAQGTDLGNSHTFTLKHPAAGRYVVIWITRLPPKPGNANRYQANVYNVVVRGTG
jgi:serine/threonine protein kinase